ncbi:transporter substrate-binding domain-containing protein [Legionella yabuuchiae]|uniref:transporter substrate-binding domain-containing protein n=1 Tax=Legionella yabuuchiae TaxID=376727 RepID=UPI0010541EFF|nr:transporter substrate-binding domain-containing protein [Legionella yabuuchiae]
MNPFPTRINVFILLIFITLGNASHSLASDPIIIGTISYNPPFELTTNDQFSGFEVEIMRVVCVRIAASCKFQRVLFHQIPELLDENKIDLGLAAIIITKPRKDDFLFSIPYKVSHLQFMTLTNSTIKSVEELQNEPIGAYKKSPSIDFLNQLFQNKATIKTYETSMDMLAALNNQEVKAIITNPEQAMYWISNSRNYQLLGNEYPVGEGYGIMASKNKGHLIDQINDALTKMENDGTLLKIYRDWL